MELVEDFHNIIWWMVEGRSTYRQKYVDFFRLDATVFTYIG